MSWIEWLKEMAERGSRGKSAGRVRAPQQRDSTYAREWVRVIKDNGRSPDPADTYIWELTREPASRRAAGSSSGPAATDDSLPPPQPDVPFDAGAHDDAADDPWGLQGDPSARRNPKEQGFNPYDTGIFDPDTDWTGKFDRR